MSYASISSPKLSSVSGLSNPIWWEDDSFLYFNICSYVCFFEKLGLTFVKSKNGIAGLNLWIEVWVFIFWLLIVMLALFSFCERLLNIRPIDWFVVEAEALYTDWLFELCCWILSFVISAMLMAPEEACRPLEEACRPPVEATLMTELLAFYIYLSCSSNYLILSFFSFNCEEKVFVWSKNWRLMFSLSWYCFYASFCIYSADSFNLASHSLRLSRCCSYAYLYLIISPWLLLTIYKKKFFINERDF